MPTPTIEIVKKLMELALHNPNGEEARSAAVQAIRLIDKFNLPVGDNVINRPDKEWVPPDADFTKTVDDIFSGKKAWADPDAKATEYDENRGSQVPGALAAPERELEDQQSAFRRQVVRAWRAIRETRANLQSEIHAYEKESRRRFTGRGW